MSYVFHGRRGGESWRRRRPVHPAPQALTLKALHAPSLKPEDRLASAPNTIPGCPVSPVLGDWHPTPHPNPETPAHFQALPQPSSGDPHPGV